MSFASRLRTVRILVIAIAILLFGTSTTCWADSVTTIAGTGAKQSSGDGKLSLMAGIVEPFGLTLGPDGALYVCEVGGHAIRRIDENTGRITTVAGTLGKPGYAGDGGPATKALLKEPYEVRFDGAGNMFFVEMQNHIVRRVDARTKQISTVAGTGKKGFSGDGGPATSATLSIPHSICLDDAGNLYICDIGNHRIRRVDLKTGIISTFAGTGERRPTPDGASIADTPLNGPRALDFDAKSHSLYLALREGNAIYRLDLKSKTVHHIAGTGKPGYSGDGDDAKKGKLAGPKGIAVGPEGDIYFADTESHTIRVVRKKSGKLETVVGDGKQGDGPDGDPRHNRLNRPHGIFVATTGMIYIGDSSNNRVRKYFPEAVGRGGVLTKLLAGTTRATRQEQLSAPRWKRIQLDAAFRSEGVAVADVNKDGKLDVIAGDVWYEAPDWKMHEIRTPGKFVAGVFYSNSFVNYTHDINGDGWDDLIYIGFPGESFSWYENPGEKKYATGKSPHWKAHVIWRSICNESPMQIDLDGDGIPELVFGSQPEAQMGFVRFPEKSMATKVWPFVPISLKGDPNKNGTFKYYHGLGAGDFNGDGLTDVVIPHGWWEAPKVVSKGAATSAPAWKFHPFPPLNESGKGDPVRAARIHVEDFDGDGDMDLLTSSAHDRGVWWFENLSAGKIDSTLSDKKNAPQSENSVRFKYHLIDDEISQTHDSILVDIDGDGQKDLVTGKRFFAHNGGDPGAFEPSVMVWYKIVREKGKPPRFIKHEIEAGLGTGIGTQFVVRDINGDGKPDIVLSNKKGVNILVQK